MYNKRQIGHEQETLAIEFLLSKGYHIKTRNFYSKSGEIDIIAFHEGYLTFIEVKYRANSNKGFPHEAIDYKKIQKISRTALYYLYKYKIPQDTPVRFDVVTILGSEVSVLQNAFEFSP